MTIQFAQITINVINTTKSTQENLKQGHSPTHIRMLAVTRLPSNLRLTTRKCKHLLTQHAWSRLVTQQIWRSHHLICHSQKTEATHKPHGSIYYGHSYSHWKVYIAGLTIFTFFCCSDRDLDPICKLDPYFLEI